MSSAAAWMFLALSLFVALFQLALVLGAPWGEFTLGGRWRGRLPPAVRLMPLLSLLLMLAFAWVIAARAGLVAVSLGDGWAWGVVAYCALGVLANAATRSVRERRLWLPVVTLMLASSLLVVL